MKLCRRYKENIAYIFIWGVIFLTPVISQYIHSSVKGSAALSWKDLTMVWMFLGAYLLIFLIHNIFLAPLLVYKKRKVLYFSLSALLIVACVVFQYVIKPGESPHGNRPFKEMIDKDGRHGPDMRMEKTLEMRADGFMPHDGHGPKRFKGRFEEGPHGPILFQQVDVIGFLLLFFMLGMNLGVKMFFKTEEDAKRFRELEHKNMENQLEYLKLQVNPHFFMNTLNNIHALVDIDPEKAKDAIVELSKMMRYVLYESDKPLIPLQREVQFLENYIKLMRLRVADNVPIKLELSPDIPNCSMPPLLLLPFVENAFKHGISIEKPSFITVNISADDNNLHFTCVNSNVRIKTLKHGGIGLTNVRKRLDLLFGTDYKLDISDGEKEYRAELFIPLNKEQTDKTTLKPLQS
jgi:hypothetical protein